MASQQDNFYLHPDITNIRHQQVRDLAWSCFGPDLLRDFNSSQVSPCHLQLTPARAAWLNRLDKQPQPLIDYLHCQRSPRLGIYFEVLWQFFISQDPALELIACNQPIHRKGKTLGEFDIVYSDKARNHVYHLELAIKFYLDALAGCDEPKPLARWIGPNGIDRLDKKVDRLLSHQIQLSDTDEGQKWLATMGIDRIQKQIALKGQLFSHQKSVSLPHKQFRPTLSHHCWLRLEELYTVIAEHTYWIVLDKPQWISPTLITDSHAVKDGHTLLVELKSYFKHSNRPIMLCALQKHGNSFEEQARYFVCADQWPDASLKDLEQTL